MNLLFVYTTLFDRQADGLLTDDDLRAVEQLLDANPQAGVVVPGAGGVRKLRVALPGRGKSGSARVIYLYVAPDERVYFLLIYRKNAKETLSAAEKQSFAALARTLRGEQP
jgi:hypothetical protein